MGKEKKKTKNGYEASLEPETTQASVVPAYSDVPPSKRNSDIAHAPQKEEAMPTESGKGVVPTSAMSAYSNETPSPSNSGVANTPQPQAVPAEPETAPAAVEKAKARYTLAYPRYATMSTASNNQAQPAAPARDVPSSMAEPLPSVDSSVLEQKAPVASALVDNASETNTEEVTPEETASQTGTTEEDKPLTIADIFAKTRQEREKLKTDASKLARFQALGQLSQTLFNPVGWAGGGSTAEVKAPDQRGYIDAFGKMDKYDDQLAALGQQEAQWNINEIQRQQKRDEALADLESSRKWQEERERSNREWQDARDERNKQWQKEQGDINYERQKEQGAVNFERQKELARIQNAYRRSNAAPANQQNTALGRAVAEVGASLGTKNKEDLTEGEKFFQGLSKVYGKTNPDYVIAQTISRYPADAVEMGLVTKDELAELGIETQSTAPVPQTKSEMRAERRAERKAERQLRSKFDDAKKKYGTDSVAAGYLERAIGSDDPQSELNALAEADPIAARELGLIDKETEKALIQRKESKPQRTTADL